jgi:chaperonin GroES
MTITPIGERVLIKPYKAEEKTKGGIFIPEAAKEKKKQGKVIAVGTFKDGKELPVKPGDTIIYGGYSQEEVEFEKEDYIIVEFKNIVAKVDF